MTTAAPRGGRRAVTAHESTSQSNGHKREPTTNEQTVASASASPDAARARKPLLLLDVDGVILTLGGTGPGIVEMVVDGAGRTLPEAVRDQLHRLAETFQLVWATSWEREANEVISPLLGLPELAWIAFDSDFEPGEHHKVRDIERFVRNRPFAWVDDELDGGCAGWAQSLSQPALLVSADPRVGITETHTQELLRFAELCSKPGRR